MVQTTQVIAALVPFGISNIGFIPVEGTDVTAIRITDQTYAGRQGHETVTMVARDIIEPLGLSVAGVVSNALYEGDDAIGAAILVRNLGDVPC